MRKFLVAVALATLLAPFAQAQSYPDRPIKLLVPLAAGSAVDIVARLVADKMGDQLGQRPFVENMAGGAGVIGMRAGARAAPDGYTVIVPNDSVLTMVPNMKSDAGYDPFADFMPVTQLSGSLQLPGGAGIEGYYQFEWRKTRLPGSGSYLSSDDYVDVGGERYILRSGVYLFRDRDLAPPNSGQFGAAFRWSSGQIDFGLYGLRFHAKDPVVYYRSGIAQAGGGPPVITDPSIVDLSIGKGGTYTLAYPRNIEIYGASISGYLGSSTVAAEISARRNTPLANSRIFLTPGQHPDADKNPLYPVGETLQAQISSITTLGPTGLWDSATFRAEAAAVDRLSVWKNAANLDPSAIKLAGAFRVSFQPTYFKVLPNLDLTLDFGLTYRAGTSSIETYQSQGPGNFDFGATATYRVVWSGSVTYSHFLGGAERKPLPELNRARTTRSARTRSGRLTDRGQCLQ